MPGDTRGVSSRSFGRGAAQPVEGGGRDKSGQQTRGERSLDPSPPQSPGLGITPPKGRPPACPRARGPLAVLAPPRAGPRAAHLPAVRGARAPAPPLCSSSRQRSPRDPPRPLDPRAPGAARLTFPAGPSPQSPPGRTLRGAFPAPQPLSTPAAPPWCVRPSPRRPAGSAFSSASTLPPPSPFGACAPRGGGPERGGARLGWVGSARAPSERPSC